MDTMVDYREQVRAVIEEYGAYKPSYGEVEVEQIIDLVSDHYQLLTVGWDDYRRIHGCLIHIDIKDGKVWIQHDGTEAGVATLLVERGVPKDAIVLAFHPPYKRPYTGFATG